jgi:predicted MFS family arabinose efflux permease
VSQEALNQPADSGMTSGERRSSLSLAFIFALRMMGLFMIYPVFAVFARQLPDATPALIGLALGIYGLTQAMLQIPFGMMSDRIGRKPVIAGGLLLFTLGSAVAALSTTIYGIILGRMLQGAGAVGSTILALGADLTREEQRTKAMAVIGMTIGLSFALAVVLGPLLNSWIGVSGIFWLTAVFGLLGIAVLIWATPRPSQTRLHRDTEAVPALFRRVLTDGQLLRLDFGIFALHAVLTATFVALPVALHSVAKFNLHQQWMLYLPVLVISVIGMVPLIIIAEKYRRMKPVYLGAILAIAAAQFCLGAWHGSLWAVIPILIVFFTAFNLMEASLPSLISKAAPPTSKGTAMGVYSSSQFLGIFIGGTLGGWVQGHYGLAAVFALAGCIALIWFGIAVSMPQPSYLSSYLLRVGRLHSGEADRLAEQLLTVQGVADAVVVGDEGVAYLKVDSKELDVSALHRFSDAGAHR